MIIYNPLTAPNTTCDTLISAVLTPSAFLTCTFDAAVTGTAGDTITDTLTATVTDTASQTADNNATANVTITAPEGNPTIAVSNVADPTTIAAPGGPIEHTVTITNTGPVTQALQRELAAADDVTVTAITDDVYGDLTTRPGSTCASGQTIAHGDTYTCTFTGDVAGNDGDSRSDVVIGTVIDASQQTGTDSDTATVLITAAAPTTTPPVSDTPPASDTGSGPPGGSGSGVGAGGDTADTGAHSAQWLMYAVLLLGLGGSFLIVGSRRTGFGRRRGRHIA